MIEQLLKEQLAQMATDLYRLMPTEWSNLFVLDIPFMDVTGDYMQLVVEVSFSAKYIIISDGGLVANELFNYNLFKGEIDKVLEDTIDDTGFFYNLNNQNILIMVEPKNFNIGVASLSQFLIELFATLF